MTIGSPSGSGATKNDIADGVDESDGRWQTLFAGSLLSQQPDHTNTKSSGAAPTFDKDAVRMSSGTDGDYGSVFAGATEMGFGGAGMDVGSILIKATYGTDVSIGTLGDEHLIGVANAGSFDGLRNQDNMAGFLPNVGDNTDGNVQVDSGGTDTTGSISYPPLSEAHEYIILIDYAGNYLTAGHTGFYVDGDPRAGDPPNADLAATPNPKGAGYMGLHYKSEANQHAMFSNYMGVTHRI